MGNKTKWEEEVEKDKSCLSRIFYGTVSVVVFYSLLVSLQLHVKSLQGTDGVY